MDCSGSGGRPHGWSVLGVRVEGPHNYPPPFGCLVSLLYLTSTHRLSLEPTRSRGIPDHSALGSKG